MVGDVLVVVVCGLMGAEQLPRTVVGDGDTHALVDDGNGLEAGGVVANAVVDIGGVGCGAGCGAGYGGYGGGVGCVGADAYDADIGDGYGGAVGKERRVTVGEACVDDVIRHNACEVVAEKYHVADRY